VISARNKCIAEFPTLLDMPMNALDEMVMEGRATAPSPEDVWHSVRQLMASPVFVKAPRMCQLLSFLIEKKLSGKEDEITEYAIGREVFRRDARCYDTTLDPVVRVQVGRLRGRLATYYAEQGAALAVRVTLPLGNYIPGVSWADGTPSCGRQPLQLASLRCLSLEQDSFVRGIDEELSARLFQAFGNVTPLCETSPTVQAGGPANLGLRHRLEGSIRVEDNNVRASMRLLDIRNGRIVWLSQFDRSGSLCMTLQAELAAAICDALQHNLADQLGGIFPS
jgi:TolB-like protein